MLLPSKKDIARSLGKSVDSIKVGYASTIGDLFHAGHIAYLREAKNYCDYLIVGIVDDPTIDRDWKNKPVQSMLERYIQIASCTYADCVIPLSHEQDLRDSLLLLQPDVRFVGEEYKGQVFTGSDIEGIKIIYLPRKHSFSSTDVRKRVYTAEKSKLDTNTISKFPEESEFKGNLPHASFDDLDFSGKLSSIVVAVDDTDDIGKQDY